MPDELTLKVSYLAGLLLVAYLVIRWYFRCDPMVRPSSSYLRYL